MFLAIFRTEPFKRPRVDPVRQVSTLIQDKRYGLRRIALDLRTAFFPHPYHYPMLFIQDFRYAVRTLIQRPGFTVVVVMTLALGIGANTTLFSLINAVVLKPPPIAAPEEVVELFTGTGDGDQYGFSTYSDYRDLKAQTDLFSDLTAFASMPVSLRTRDRTMRVQGALVTEDYFEVLGIDMAAGTTFQENTVADDNTGVVIGYRLWQRLFGGEAGLIGQPLQVNGRSFTIIGIAPQGFTGIKRAISVEVWMPLEMEQQISHLPFSRLDRLSHWLTVVGRLKPELSLTRAQARLNVTANQLALTYPEAWLDDEGRPRRLTVLPEQETRVPMLFRDAMLDYVTMLSIVVGMVLLIACANVANLMIVRTIGRRQEIAVRVALGAPRRRIIRQFLAETVVLAGAAGIISLFCAMWVGDLLLAFQPALPVPLIFEVDMDTRVLLFTGAVTVVAGLLFGLGPALQAFVRDPAMALKDSAGGITGPFRLAWVRNGLVVFQIALTLILLVGAGLFVRSLQQAYTIPIGFDPDDVLLLSFDISRQGYDRNAGHIFYTDLLDETRRLNGVASASLASTLPLGGGPGGAMVSIDIGASTTRSAGRVYISLVGPDYFETMKTPVVEGRGIKDTDDATALPVMVVNETFARTYLGGTSPVGAKMSLNEGRDEAPLTVVGVARDGKYQTLDEKSKAVIYLPLLQHIETLHQLASGVTLAVRTHGEPLEQAAAVRGVINRLDQAVPLFNITTLAAHTSIVYLPVRFAGTILGLFGLLALIIAIIGLYGLMTHAVNRRMQEIGIRIALGATQQQILKLVMQYGALLILIGIGIGLAVAYSLRHLLSPYLYGIDATDPVTFFSIIILLVLVGLLACYIPARRALQVEPMDVLRRE